MAFFCTQTGARIVAPGVHESVQPGGMPSFDGSKASVAAETAAIVVLSGCRRHDLECEPSPPAQSQARAAAMKAFAEAPKTEPATPESLGISGKLEFDSGLANASQRLAEAAVKFDEMAGKMTSAPTAPVVQDEPTKPVTPSTKVQSEAPAKGGRHARDKDAEPKPDKH